MFSVIFIVYHPAWICLFVLLLLYILIILFVAAALCCWNTNTKWVSAASFYEYRHTGRPWLNCLTLLLTYILEVKGGFTEWR